MYKLIGHSMTKGEWFAPETQPMTLQERDGSSTITIEHGRVEIGFNDWLLDDDWPEGPYVWRVKSLGDDASGKTDTIELEHLIMALDGPTLGEVTPATIAGGSATTCTAKQAAQYILAQQSDWVLGDFDYESVSMPYEFDGDTLLDALETVTDTLEDSVWEYDMSVYPFKLHIRHRDNTVRCEMRGGRNLTTLKRTRNRSGMYTRFYPIGKRNLKIDGEYISKNENIYGRIDHRETDESKTTKANLLAWAQARLNRHCEPMVSISISGLELSQDTGEALDRLTMNKICQCPLPEYGTTITERIVKKQWRDRRKEPENVMITLANNSQDVTTIIKKGGRGGGKASAGQAKQNYLFEVNGENLRYEVFDESGHVHGLLRMTEQSLRVEFENLNESTRSELQMTAESLRVEFQNEASSLRSAIQVTAESLRVEFQNEASSLRSAIQVTAESLRVEFQNEASSLRSAIQVTAESLRVEFQNEASSLRSAIQVTAESLHVEFSNEASSIRSEVHQTAESWNVRVSGVVDANGNITAASIALAINNSTGQSEAKIDADRVYIGNSKSTTVINGKCALSDVTADYIEGKIATIPTLRGIAGSFSGNLSCSGMLAGSVYVGGGGSYKNISNPIMSVVITGPVNDVYTLTATAADGTYNSYSFSRATSLSGAWGSGQLTVSASPQGNTFKAALQTEGHWGSGAGENSQHYYGSISAKHNGGSTSHQTGAYFEIDASGIYTSGYNAGKPISGTAGSRVATTNPAYNFNITKGDGTVATLQIDVTGIYADARSGYTEGTFSLATVTLQGTRNDNVYKVQNTGVSYYQADTALALYEAGTVTKYDRGTGLTARPVVNSGGTIYYEANDATTYYKAGTVTKNDRGSSYSITPIGDTAYRLGTPTSYYMGNGGSFTPQGTAGPKLVHDGSARHYDVNGNLIGNFNWYHASSSGTQYYNAGSGTKYARGDSVTARPVLTEGGSLFYAAGDAVTVYPGNGGSFTVQGEQVSVTPIKATSAIRLGASGTYYPGNGGSFTVQGTAKSVTPIKADSEKKLTGVTMYEAGTTYSNTYYTKS